MRTVGDRLPQVEGEVVVDVVGQRDERVPDRGHAAAAASVRGSARSRSGREDQRRAPALALDGRDLDALRAGTVDDRRLVAAPAAARFVEGRAEQRRMVDAPARRASAWSRGRTPARGRSPKPVRMPGGTCMWSGAMSGGKGWCRSLEDRQDPRRDRRPRPGRVEAPEGAEQLAPPASGSMVPPSGWSVEPVSPPRAPPWPCDGLAVPPSGTSLSSCAAIVTTAAHPTRIGDSTRPAPRWTRIDLTATSRGRGGRQRCQRPTPATARR